MTGEEGKETATATVKAIFEEARSQVWAAALREQFLPQWLPEEQELRAQVDGDNLIEGLVTLIECSCLRQTSSPPPNLDALDSSAIILISQTLPINAARAPAPEAVSELARHYAEQGENPWTFIAAMMGMPVEEHIGDLDEQDPRTLDLLMQIANANNVKIDLLQRFLPEVLIPTIAAITRPGSQTTSVSAEALSDERQSPRKLN